MQFFALFYSQGRNDLGSFHLGVGSRESIYSEYPNNLGKLTLHFVGVGNLPPTKIATLTVYK